MMSGLKRLPNTLFFPTVWLADHLSMLKKFLLFLSLLSYLSKVTISFGITTFLSDDSFDTVLERVDKALYMAKEQGRNRVIDL